MEMQGDSNFHVLEFAKRTSNFPFNSKFTQFPLVGKNFSLDPSEWMIPC